MIRISLFITALIFLSAISSIAQNNGSIKGIVKDSLTGAVLESATVSIFKKDSSLINYQLTDGYGVFSINKLPVDTDVFLNITYVGFKNYYKRLKLDSAAHEIVVLLAPSFHDSTNVTVMAHIPIRMNGDTLEINPAAFKMDPNAVVEDLLTAVPGMIVWADGTITLNGRKIPSVLVDGKPFMGSNDARLATQNLPKNAIDKIQVYQEVDRSLKPDERKLKDSLLTMNIKLKEDKRMGFFGKAGAGYGSADRFESDLSFQAYNKQTSFGIGGGYNNINKNIGNLNEMFQNNTYRNYNPNLWNVGNFNTDGINKYHSIGGVFTHNFIETTNSRQNDRITVNYTKSGNDKFLKNLSLQSRTTSDQPQFVEDTSNTNSINHNHSLGINYIKTNSYNDNFNINANATVNNSTNNSNKTTDVRDTTYNPISKTNEQSNDEIKSSSQSLLANYSMYKEENPLVQFNANLNLNNNHTESERYVKSAFKSFVNSKDDTTYNRKYNNIGNNLSASGGLDYNGLRRLLFGRFNLWGINLNLNQQVSYTKSTRDDQVFDYDTLAGKYSTNFGLTNSNTNEEIAFAPSLRVSKAISKWNETGGRNLSVSVNILEEFKQNNNTSSIDVRNLDRSFNFFRYNGSINYYYNKQEKFSYNIDMGYSKNFEYANIDQLYTITDDLNKYYIRIGNPNLKNIVNHNYNFNGNFNSQNPKSKYSINGSINGSFVKSLNPVTDSLVNGTSGERVYYYINGQQSQNYYLGYNINISRKLKKSNIQLMYNGTYNNRKNPNYIDHIFSETVTSGISNNITLQLNLKSRVILYVGKTINSNHSRQSGAGLTSYKNLADISRLGLTLNLPKFYAISSTLDHTKNTDLKKPIVLWNVFATCRVFKNQQGEVKFSAMDILKQFQNISNFADGYGTTTHISNGLQQYFMLTFSYYPRKFGKTEIRKREVKNEW